MRAIRLADDSLITLHQFEKAKCSADEMNLADLVGVNARRRSGIRWTKSKYRSARPARLLISGRRLYTFDGGIGAGSTPIVGSHSVIVSRMRT